MNETKRSYSTIDEYIAQFTDEIQVILQNIRNEIKKAAPEANEKISYQMPAFDLNGILVYFAAFKNHIGFYPTASGIEAFKDELTGYKWSKGAIQFPLDQPIPYDLVQKITLYRVNENRLKQKSAHKK